MLAAGLLAGAPVAIPLSLARLCVEPFAGAIKSLSRSCPPLGPPPPPGRAGGDAEAGP